MKISWKQKTTSIGRNGAIKTTGIEISRNMFDHTIDIQPLNSRGDVANCIISIACDPDALRDIAQLLNTIAKNLRYQKKLKEKS